MSTPTVNVADKTVTFSGTTYDVRALGEDEFTVLVKGVPVGRIVFSFGAGNGVPEGDAISEDDLTSIADAWFTAISA